MSPAVTDALTPPTDRPTNDFVSIKQRRRVQVRGGVWQRATTQTRNRRTTLPLPLLVVRQEEKCA